MELRHCPFCGQGAPAKPFIASTPAWRGEYITYWVECPSCGLSQEANDSETPGKAADIWNETWEGGKL